MRGLKNFMGFMLQWSRIGPYFLGARVSQSSWAHPGCPNPRRSACQCFRLGCCKFLVRQHALGMQVREILKLGAQLVLHWSRSRGRRRCSLLLCLCIRETLLIRCISLLLCRRILVCVFLLLMVADSAGSAGNDCCAHCHTRYTGYGSSYCSSSHHVDLLVNP
jgi:hypothetical protein